MILQTERLVLRPWRETDAADLYKYAKDEQVGPIAGWPPHKSIEESAEIIRTVFAQEGVYAVTMKEDDISIGCIGLITGSKSNFPISDSEGEVSYWIGVPFWGQGLIPEAMCEIIRYGFEDLKLTTLWCGYFAGNEKSKRAQEKCGFRHFRTEANKIGLRVSFRTYEALLYVPMGLLWGFISYISLGKVNEVALAYRLPCYFTRIYFISSIF